MSAPLAEHSARGFGDRMKQAGNAGFVTDGAERKREECFLKVAVAIEEHPLIFEKGCFTRERAGKCFADYRPRCSPAFREILTHGDRMLLTADRPIAIVVDLHMPWSPGQRNREIGREAETDGSTQALGP